MIIKELTSIKEISKMRHIPSYYTTFDAINEDIDMGDAATLRFDRTDPFSISFWVNNSDWNAGFMVSKRETSVNYAGYMIISSANKLRVILRSTLSKALDVITNATLTNGQDYFITVTYDGLSLSSSLKVYVDSISSALTVTTSTLTSSIANSQPFKIGSANVGGYFNGSLDEVAVFSSTLTQVEIDLLYGLGKTVMSSYSVIPTLVSHWKMDTLNPVDETGTNNGTSANMDSTNIIEFY